jgi:hypothetical protein
MADPVQPSSSAKWIWVALVVLLTALIIVWLVSPSGNRDGDVDDPIATEDFGEVDTVETGEVPAPEPFAPGGDPD